MRSDLPARLRAQADGPIWDDNHAQVRALLREAAEHIEQQLETLTAVGGTSADRLRAMLAEDPDTQPIEASRPCFKCGRTGPLVVDRWPQLYQMRNHPERFMHGAGICPVMPDSAPSSATLTQRVERIERWLDRNHEAWSIEL